MLDRGAYKAGGAVTDVSSKVLPPGAAAALGFGTNVGIQALPVLLGGAGGVRAAPAIERKAMDIMQSALKPAKAAQKSGDAERAVRTLLERGANVTEGGVSKLTKAIDELDEKLTAAIKDSGATVDKLRVLKPIKEALARFRNETSTTDNLAKIRQAAEEFWNHPSLRGMREIPVQKAQEMKRANYRALGDKAYGVGLKPEAEREGIKAVTRGLKEGVEEAVPEAGPLNAEMGPLINARDLAQERVLMSGNKNLGGLGILNPHMLLPWLADRSELVKSLLARGLFSGQRVVPGTAGAVAGSGVGMAEGRRER